MPAQVPLAPLLTVPNPSSSSTGVPVTPQHVENWFSRHGSLLIGHGSQIAGIVLACIVIRLLVRKSINRVVRHTTKLAESRASTLLGGAGLVAGERTRQRAQAIGSVLRSLASAVIFCVGALMVISVLTIPIAPILASLSAVGVAVGLGARDLITDFISGVFMIVEDQYGVGDVIDTSEVKGTVEEVGLRITKVRDVDGVIWYLRNGAIKRVGNQSQGWARAVVDVPVAYTEDVGKVREIMELTAGELYDDEAWHDRFIDGQPKILGVESLDGAYVIVRLQARTAPQKNFEVARELRARLKAALDSADVQVASLK
jgi:small-conductance mechanosensitive channel